MYRAGFAVVFDESLLQVFIGAVVTVGFALFGEWFDGPAQYNGLEGSASSLKQSSRSIASGAFLGHGDLHLVGPVVAASKPSLTIRF